MKSDEPRERPSLRPKDKLCLKLSGPQAVSTRMENLIPKNLGGKSRCLIDCPCSTLSHAVESFRGTEIDLQTTKSQESLICCLSSRLQAGLGVVSAEVINLDRHSHFVIDYHDHGMSTLLNLGIWPSKHHNTAFS
jgi:hypothetical protein